MRVLLDLNVILDLLLERDPWRVEAERIWDANRDGRIDAFVSAAGVPTIFYVVRKQTDLTRAHLAVVNCLRSLEVAAVDRPTLEMAANLSGSDYEDNLQIACASLAGLDAIVTRDPKGFSGSTIAVLSPSELLDRLSKDEHD
jgi:predicted nucleic acid-binding protein